MFNIENMIPIFGSHTIVSKEELNNKEHFFPLKVFICKNCWLAQAPEYFPPTKLFKKNYCYFSPSFKRN